MNGRVITMALTIGLSTVCGLYAHDAKLHKGKSTTGEILSVAADRLEIRTPAGTVKISFTEKTKFEHGKEAVDKTHLKIGDTISVIGTKLPSGELVAKEILLGVTKPSDKMDHSKMGQGSKPATDHKH